MVPDGSFIKDQPSSNIFLHPPRHLVGAIRTHPREFFSFCCIFIAKWKEILLIWCFGCLNGIRGWSETVFPFKVNFSVIFDNFKLLIWDTKYDTRICFMLCYWLMIIRGERDNERGSLCSGPEIAFLQFYDVIVEIVMSGTIYRVKLWEAQPNLL